MPKGEPESPTTPMMRQYRRFKQEHPDAVLFFRMGDFYEMFFDDAKIAARVLGLALTSRSKGENAIPMAGVPHHAAESYMQRLIQAGYKVALCDQIQDPKEAKGLVDRGVTRVVTPGTLTEDGLLDNKSHNYLAAVCVNDRAAGVAWVDLSTGGFQAQDAAAGELGDALARLSPSECLVPDSARDEAGGLADRLAEEIAGMITPRPDWVFGRDTARRTLLEHFGVKSLEGFGCQDLGLGLSAAGAVLQYLQETQRTSLGHIRSISRFTDEERLILDRSTQLSLELTQTLRTGQRHGSLLWVLDRTLTPMGGRLLRDWVTCPLRDRQEIVRRHDRVEAFHKDAALRSEVRGLLHEVYDVERLASRISCGRANARDLLALKRSLSVLPGLQEILRAAPPEGVELAGRIDLVEEARNLIGAAIATDPPVTLRDGGLIRDGYHSELDELRVIQRDGRSWIARFQAEESERTGIPSLKVGYNRVFGYYIEVTHVHAERVPPEYMRKQTLKNAERYITPQLKEYETRVLTAEERGKDLEYRLFVDVRERVAAHIARLQQSAAGVAEIDLYAALAEVAEENVYVRPEITDGLDLAIADGRHPVLEKTILDEAFVPNDCDLDGEQVQMMVITGPNMAGKSTYIRQVALIVLMAQMGGFVPAKKARIGAVDRIFTRVGAADELSRGQSTFMVEMLETANILNNASRRSLIVLDEVGRGTSTFDGVSIAWAVGEYIHERIKARTMFATHYHELTELAQLYEGIRNYNIAVREWRDEIVFIRKIVDGGTDKSYGLHVARLAGIPGFVVERAKDILSNLESNAVDSQDMPRLAAGGEPGEPGGPIQMTLFSNMGDILAEAVRRLDLDNMTPVQALTRLTEIKKRLEEKKQ